MPLPVQERTPTRDAAPGRLDRLEATLSQAETDRLTLRELLRRAQDERRADEARGVDPVVLCHHTELLSLLLRRLAETERVITVTRKDLRSLAASIPAPALLRRPMHRRGLRRSSSP